MEISGNLPSLYQQPSSDQRGAGRASGDQGFLREQIAADKRTSGNNPQEQLTRDQAVQSKNGADYTEILQRTFSAQGRGNSRRGTGTSANTAPTDVQRALDAYQSTANDLEGNGIDLLPRVDRYV